LYATLLATGITPVFSQTDTGIHKPPALLFDNPEMTKIVRVYQDALRNLMETNTVWYQGDHVIRAGAEYARPWTRDGSLNSMMAGSLLEPAVAESTLWHITDQRRTVGGQWWDRVIWVIAAWHHYKVTGDKEFLADAYACGTASLRKHREQYYVPDYGLFRGPSHLCDGIAGYPDPPAVNTDGNSSYCEDYPNLVYIMPTSLQAIYYGAYRVAAEMARALDRAPSEIGRWQGLATDLKRQADEHLWMPAKHRYGYFVHGRGPKAGQLEPHQEGAGLTYSLLFGMADDAQAHEILASFHNQPHGMTAVWPHFSRFNDKRPGRHNVLVWPQMSAYWALAALRRGRPDVFQWEFENLTGLFHSTSPNIREIYDSVGGVANGGIQNGRQWKATENQTWGATGYLGLVYGGLFGMRFETDGIRFQPHLPAQWGDCRLEGLVYRNARLNIALTGLGAKVTGFEIDGRKQERAIFPAALAGEHSIAIRLQ
jgi:hypothetical protein